MDGGKTIEIRYKRPVFTVRKTEPKSAMVGILEREPYLERCEVWWLMMIMN